MVDHLGRLALLALLAGPAAGTAQESPSKLAPLLEVRDLLARLGSREGPSIWPGFRPDETPLVFVQPERGALLINWSGDLPEGFTPVDGMAGAWWRSEAGRGAASTSVTLGGRAAAQVVVDTGASVARLVGLAAHEAFHVLQGAARAEGRRFGTGENSFLVTRYPVFEPENEAALALEGKLLAAALRARSDSAARDLARQFLAVRQARQRSLDPDLTAFEMQAELNEGLAEYAAVRMWRALSADPRHGERAGTEADRALALLDDLTAEPRLSIRLRYYATGAALGLLLDRLDGPGWQARLMERNLSLQDGLGFATGYFEAEAALGARAAQSFDRSALGVVAERRVAELQAFRRAQMDSVLAAPGLEVAILTDAIGEVGLCGIDPQNLLQVGPGVLLHTRWVRPCAGRSLQAEFNTPLVQDVRARLLRAVIGAEGEVRITAEGQAVALADGQRLEALTDLVIESPRATIRSARAAVERSGRTLWVRPLGR